VGVLWRSIWMRLIGGSAITPEMNDRRQISMPRPQRPGLEQIRYLGAIGVHQLFPRISYVPNWGIPVLTCKVITSELLLKVQEDLNRKWSPTTHESVRESDIAGIPRAHAIKHNECAPLRPVRKDSLGTEIGTRERVERSRGAAYNGMTFCHDRHHLRTCMMPMTVVAKDRVDLLQASFLELFGQTPRIYRAPARVNLIGEHTDYNDGFVMPAAIGFSTLVAGATRSDQKLVVYSEQFGETAELDMSALAGPPRRHWSDYVRGVAAELTELGRVVGTNLLISSDVPLGAGLSSSAALEVSTALALSSLSDLQLPLLELVKLSQRAEHKFAGTLCGIMDQFIATFGQSGNALLLDCRSLEYRPVPIPNDVCLVICNSMVKHELASGEYNKRRADCDAGVLEISKYVAGIKALRDVSTTQLETYRLLLSSLVYRRCRHVITENERTQAAATALCNGDSQMFGQLMYASHRSLAEEYQVSCPELDLLVEAASKCPGVYGARMTGGGFGGCTINLVHVDAVGEFARVLREQYEKDTGITPSVYVSQPSQGAGPVRMR